MKISITKIILINFIVLLISIFFIEIFFGHWFSNHGFGPYMREHRLKKNPATLSFEGVDYKFIYKRNYHGFRGEEIDPSMIEAVIIGGSTTDERYKPEKFTITGNLNSLLKQKGYNFKITNAGIEGQSTAGHIYNFKHWFSKLKNFSPKLFIFYIGINDYSAKPDFKLEDNVGGDGHVKNPEKLEVFLDTIKSNSFFYDKLRIIKHKYYVTGRTMRYDHNFFDKEKIENYKYVNYQSALKIYDVDLLKKKHKKIINNYLDRIKILNNYVVEKNAIPIFITQVQFDGLRKEDRLFILNHSLIKYCRDNNIHCIDLADQLVGQYDYWSDGMHTTVSGSKIIAETIIDDLVKIIEIEKLF
tara:strand:+ start:51 stop:1121 length:1071 start_codon:yes stop_codon:yes gene_type:complete